MYYDKLKRAVRDAFYNAQSKYYGNEPGYIHIIESDKYLMIWIAVYAGEPKINIEKLIPTLTEYNLELSSEVPNKSSYVNYEFVLKITCKEINKSTNNNISW